MMLVRLEPAASRSGVKHSTTVRHEVNNLEGSVVVQELELELPIHCKTPEMTS